MRETKTVLHRFDSSAFDEELGFLDAMSGKGWQMTRMRAFTQEYIWDDSAIYRYAIDYQDSLSSYDFSRYREEFEDHGWSFAANRGDWYVFRRPYDPALPEEEYLLYTDVPSFRDMKSRASLAVNITGLLYLPIVLRYFSSLYPSPDVLLDILVLRRHRPAAAVPEDPPRFGAVSLPSVEVLHPPGFADVRAEHRIPPLRYGSAYERFGDRRTERTIHPEDAGLFRLGPSG